MHAPTLHTEVTLWITPSAQEICAVQNLQRCLALWHRLVAVRLLGCLAGWDTLLAGTSGSTESSICAQHAAQLQHVTKSLCQACMQSVLCDLHLAWWQLQTPGSLLHAVVNLHEGQSRPTSRKSSLAQQAACRTATWPAGRCLPP